MRLPNPRLLRVLLEFNPQLACIDFVSAIDVLFVLLVGAIVSVWEF